MDEVEQDTTGFTPVYVLTQACGMLVVVLTGVWMGHFRGGFAWQSQPALEFNWHPLLMSISLIYLYGNGILIYRVFRHERKKKLKYTHAIVMISSFLLALIGLKAVLDSHNLPEKPIPNFYSLHSWMGVITLCLFFAQWLGGLITFLFPGLASHLRTYFLPIHVFCGMMVFILACATALMGITEKAIFSMKDYSQKTAEGTMVNWIGLLIVIFAGLVIYLATSTRFKRLNKPEDEMLLTETINE